MLSAARNSHAAIADAIDFQILRHHEPHKLREAGHARDATAHVPSGALRRHSDCLWFLRPEMIGSGA